MDNQEKMNTEETRGSRHVSFELYINGHQTGNVIAEHVTASASFNQCSYGSVNVKIYSGGQLKADFDIPEVNYTTVSIPFSVNIGDSITYIISWKTGNNAGYAKGSFTLNY